MNHLAHCYLSDHTELGIVGSLMGDFVKGRLETLDYPAPVLRAIRAHRTIDSVTDAHPRVRRSWARFVPPYRRYAAVLVDVFYDHFLARHWDDFHAIPLDEFSATVYAALDRHHRLLPPRLQRFARYMKHEDLLYNYRRRRTIGRSLVAMSGRLRRPNPLPEAMSQLELHYRALEEDFLVFFPDLVRRISRTAARG